MTVSDNGRQQSKMLTFAGVLGLTGIGLGAFGAHALKAILEIRGSMETWSTAVEYQLLHAVAFLAVAVWARTEPTNPWLARVSAAWISGVLLFSGSLYLLALGGPRILGPVTPLGGALLMLGWALLLVAVRSRGGAEPGQVI